MGARSGIKRGFERLSDRVGGGIDLTKLIYLAELVYEEPGTYPITPPANASLGVVELVGGGGPASNNQTSGRAGGGGAGVVHEFPVLADQSIQIQVGAASADTSLTVAGSVIALAKGTATSTGAASSSCIGNRKYSGGLGGMNTASESDDCKGADGQGPGGAGGFAVRQSGRRGGGGGAGGPLGGNGASFSPDGGVHHKQAQRGGGAAYTLSPAPGAARLVWYGVAL